MYTKRYYVEKIDDVTYVRGFSSKVTMDEFFTEISEKIAFSDCNETEILEIILDDERVWYDGWKPNNHFVFCDIYKRRVWEGYFPEWAH